MKKKTALFSGNFHERKEKIHFLFTVSFCFFVFCLIFIVTFLPLHNNFVFTKTALAEEDEINRIFRESSNGQKNENDTSHLNGKEDLFTIPAKKIPSKKLPVTAVGDSVLLGAKKTLAEIFELRIDAKVSRQSQVVIDLVLSMKKQGLLDDVVIVHTGNNGPVTEKMLTDLLEALRDRKRVVLVNNREPRNWVASNNALYTAMAPRYPNVRIMDWYSNSVNHPEYFFEDGVHLSGKGAKRYAQLAADIVAYPDAQDVANIFNGVMPCPEPPYWGNDKDTRDFFLKFCFNK